MIPIFPRIVDDSAYIATSSEVVRNAMWQYLYQSGIMDKLMDRGYYRDQVGKDSRCYWHEAFFYYDLIDYMVIMFEDIKDAGLICTDPTFNSFVAQYQLPCIKKTLLCRYGASGVLDGLKGTLVDTLQKKLNLCCPPDEGISYMQILGNDCNVFHVYPQV